MSAVNISHVHELPVAGQSLIDELVRVTETGDVKERLRILQRVTDLFVAGSRGYSGQQIALFDDVLQRLVADIEVKRRALRAASPASTPRPRSSSARSPSTTRSKWPDRC